MLDASTTRLLVARLVLTGSVKATLDAVHGAWPMSDSMVRLEEKPLGLSQLTPENTPLLISGIVHSVHFRFPTASDVTMELVDGLDTVADPPPPPPPTPPM